MRVNVCRESQARADHQARYTQGATAVLYMTQTWLLDGACRALEQDVRAGQGSGLACAGSYGSREARRGHFPLPAQGLFLTHPAAGPGI